MIWKKPINIDELNRMGVNTMAALLGIRFTGSSDNSLIAEMPVDHRTHQPAGVLHGGASVALAETMGSVASFMCLENDMIPVGLEINANHVRPVATGYVIGTVTPLHIGARTHVWNIKIENKEGKLICASRLTTAIIPRPK
ncbi:MAG: hotdog fold thioesterase [Bdellovibrionota bacterium]